MSLPRYESYRDSGVGWLGHVPNHWSLQRLGLHFDERREKVSDIDFPPLSVTKNGVVPQLETAAKTDDGDNRKKVLAGDFVVNSRSDRKGSSGLSELDGSVSLINTVLTPWRTMLGRFAHHLLRSVVFQEEYYRFGKGIVADLWSTNYSEMRNILLAVPTLPEQAAIVTFLDRETAKIDALMESQRRLIELLKEKRQAVISRAVIKGLAPSAPMRDSGVEWIGEVPAHWRVVPLAKLCRPGTTITYGIIQAGPDIDGGIPYIRTSDMSGDSLPADGYLRTSPEIDAAYSRSKVQVGDLVIAIRATIGKPLVVPPHLDGANLTQGTARFSPGSECIAEYIRYCLVSSGAEAEFERLGKGATFKEITLEMLRKFRVPCPPIAEQQEIARAVTRQIGQIDELLRSVVRSLELLQERRAALISAAVTGKIDVRGVAAEAVAA